LFERRGLAISMRRSILASTLFASACAVAPPTVFNTPTPPDSDGTPPSSDGPTYARDIKPILDARCINCHDAGGIAPFPLTSYAEVSPMAAAIGAVVSTRQMPPWKAAPGCTDYLGDFSLTDAQIAAISSWVSGGAPEGDPSQVAAPLASAARRLSRVDRTLSMAAPYTPQQAPDDYHCFVLDWPGTADEFVTGFSAKPGNRAVVHHAIAFLITPDKVAELAQKDAAEPGPGYTCFGGTGISGRGGWLGAWAPGSEGYDFPTGTGIRVTPGSKVVLQIHYNVLTAGPMPDQTSIDFKLDPSVDKEARIIPFTNPAWPRGGMTIPAGQSDVTYSYAADPTLVLDALFGPGGGGYTLYSSALHMHQLGIKGRVEIARPAANECMLDIEDWSFHWQNQYEFSTPKTIHAGDKISLTCQWDNSQAHQPIIGGRQINPADVAWGEGTTDEMCIAVVYVTKSN
jgi:hypothetical protein